MITEIRIRASPIQRQIQCLAIPDIVVSKLCSHVGECRHDVETLAINERVCGIGRRPVKRAGTEAADLDFVGPDIRVDDGKVLVENEAVLVIRLECVIARGRIWSVVRTSFFGTEAWAS